MHLYQWYIIISAFLIIFEIFAPGFVLLPIGVAGLMTAVVAYFRPELWLHAVFFICGGGLALLAVGRLREKMEADTPSLSVGPTGHTGVVVNAPEGTRGLQVKVFGDVWEVADNSVPQQNIHDFPAGTNVKVTGVIGNKITIEKI